jgi:hypothetical protein
LDIAGDDDDQVQVGDDLDDLAAVAPGWEAVVAGHGPNAPQIAVVVGFRRDHLGVGLGGGPYVGLGDELVALPATPVEVQEPQLGQVAAGQLEPVEAKVVAL